MYDTLDYELDRLILGQGRRTEQGNACWEYIQRKYYLEAQA